MWPSIITSVLGMLSKIVGPLMGYFLAKKQAKLKRLENDKKALKENARIAAERISQHKLIDELRRHRY